jgi:hypothetical protein
MTELRVTCDIQNRVDYKTLKPTQGELKSLSKDGYERFKKSVLKHGIHSPCAVWLNPNRELQTLDGHNRCRSFSQLEREGYKVPLVPIYTIEAPDLKSAKEILLTLVSQFAHIEAQGLYEFALGAEISMEDLRDYDFPNLDLDKFEMEFFKDTVEINEKEVDENIETEKECPSCGYKW